MTNRMRQEQIRNILILHDKWLQDIEGGEYADLKGAYLRDADLQDADLQDANLRGADLKSAYLQDANLKGAFLRGADLRGADLRGADLRGADLRGADLRDANLQDADLRGADLQDADLQDANLRGADLQDADLKDAAFSQLQCPEKGAYTGFKKAGGYIVELKIPAKAKRSSATSRKCRCSEAQVISITKLDGSKTDIDSVPSNWDSDFIYKVGETVKVDNFEEDRWAECAAGIHHFITRQEAVDY